MSSFYHVFAEEFINGITLSFKAFGLGPSVGVDRQGGDTTLEKNSVSDVFRGRQVICFPRGNLLCYYREAILYNRRWMCSSLIHELKSTKTCFDYGICKHGTCMVESDEKKEQSFWNREQPAAIGIIVMAVVMFLSLCGCAACACR